MQYRLHFLAYVIPAAKPFGEVITNKYILKQI